jgi:hypothetical protein
MQLTNTENKGGTGGPPVVAQALPVLDRHQNGRAARSPHQTK